MSTLAAPLRYTPSLRNIRMLCTALAAIVVFDAAWVRAPGLALLALPFLVGALRVRRGTKPAMVVLTAWALLYVVVGANYAIANGMSTNVGDFAFAYIGTPIAFLLGACTVLTMKRPVGT